MFISTIVFCILSIIILIYVYLKYSDRVTRHEFARRNVKFVQPGNLFMIVASGKRFEVVIDEAVKREGPVFGFNLFGSYTIVVSDPEMSNLILTKEFPNFPNRRKFNTTDPILSDNVMFAEDEQWKRLRSIIAPAFSFSKLKRMQPCFDDAIKHLVAKLSKSNEIVDIKSVISSFSMDVIIQTAYGIKIDAQSDSENPTVRNAAKLFENANSIKNILTFTIMFLWPWLSKALDLRWNGEVTDYFRKLAMAVIKRKRKDMQANRVNPMMTCFIELILEAEQESALGAVSTAECKNKYITNDEIIANAIMFFLAGADTTTSALSLILYNLALNTEVQEKLYQELTSSSGDQTDQTPTSSISIEALSQFRYLNAVFNETLRLYPPAVFVERTANRDITLETSQYQIHVKKGDIIHIPIFSLHKLSTQFSEPDKFNPERFFTLDSNQTFHHKNAFIPFGQGKRECIAKNLGVFAAKLALVQLVKNFKFEKCAETKIPLDFKNNGDLASPVDVKLKVVKRCNI